jgi:hypothetical protein
MWPVARRRRAVSPPFYNSYDSLDLYRNYPTYDAISPSYSYNYGLGLNALGLTDYVGPTKAIEMATRAHVMAQKDFEKAKEKYGDVTGGKVERELIAWHWKGEETKRIPIILHCFDSSAIWRGLVAC